MRYRTDLRRRSPLPLGMHVYYALTQLKAAIAQEAGDGTATRAALSFIKVKLVEGDIRQSEPLQGLSATWQDSVINRVAQARSGIWHTNHSQKTPRPPEPTRDNPVLIQCCPRSDPTFRRGNQAR